MERYLGRRNDVQTAICVQLGEGTEGLHRGLLVCLGVVGALEHNITACQHGFDIAVAFLTGSAQVALIICTDRAVCDPVFLGMNQNRVVLGLMEVQNRLEHLVLDLNHAQRTVDCLVGLTCDNRDRVTDKAHAAVKNQAVIRRGFREGLASHGETVLRNILISQHAGDARYLLGDVHVDVLDQRMRVGRAQNFDDQRVLGSDIVGIDRLTGGQRTGIRLAHARSYILLVHASSFSARYLRMARSWLT